MGHFVDELQNEATDAIAAMKEAATKARHTHARAELMRHMRTTAAKNKTKPKAEAVEATVAEWMEAWHLPRSEWPHIAHEMERFTEAFYDYAQDATDAADTRLREATDGLDAALAREGTTISDQMAFRSMCAHGWWDLVLPTPADLPGRADRPTVPKPEAGKPFWEAKCAEQCL
jgi:hypothetical protein